MKTVRRIWWLILALLVAGAAMALRPADSAPARISLHSAVSFPVDI